MVERISTLREQAAEFRRLVGTFSSLETHDHLVGLATQCERLAEDMERATPDERHFGTG